MFDSNAAGVIATFKEHFPQDKVSAGIKASIWHLFHVMTVLTKEGLAVGCLCKTTPVQFFILLTRVCALKLAQNSHWNASGSACVHTQGIRKCSPWLDKGPLRLFISVVAGNFNTLMFAALQRLTFLSRKQLEEYHTRLHLLRHQPEVLQYGLQSLRSLGVPSLLKASFNSCCKHWLQLLAEG